MTARVACCALALSVAGSVSGAAFDSRAFLAQFAPGTSHEARPHGVPTSYDWQARSIGGTPSRPSVEATHMNLWGQVYVDLTNYHAPNSRVEVKGSQVWILWGSTWTLGYRTDNLGGGAWTEDFTSSGGPFDMRTEPDGGRSFVPADGYNAHFWPNLSYIAVPTVPRAVVVVASTRLVLGSVSGLDDRASSAYVIGMGADWRKPDGSCPNNICTGFGVGRFVRPGTAWRVVAMSTMSSADLAALPMPPDSAFRMPDGNYPGGTGVARTWSRAAARQRPEGPVEAFRLDGSRVGGSRPSGAAGLVVTRGPGWGATARVSGGPASER